MPDLLVEVDNHTEPAAVVAAKIERCRRFFRRQVKNDLGCDIPLWSTLWDDSGRCGFPPVALEFTKDFGAQARMNRIKTICDLSRVWWQPRWETSLGWSLKASEENRTGNYQRAVEKVAALHGKVRRQRLDHAHKTALVLVRAHGFIAHENLKIRNMSKTPAPRPDPEMPGSFLPNEATEGGIEPLDRTVPFAASSSAAAASSARPAEPTGVPGVDCPLGRSGKSWSARDRLEREHALVTFVAPPPIPRAAGSVPFLGHAIQLIRDNLGFIAALRTNYGPLVEITLLPGTRTLFVQDPDL
ncbi:hypothetical protein AB0C64_44490, partial [Streptomyces sp900116325]